MCFRVVLLAATVFVAGGCGPETFPPRFVRTAQIYRPPKPSGGHVKVFIAERPSRPYRSIGIITTQQVKFSRALHLVLLRAAKVGCDAIIPMGSASIATGAQKGPMGTVQVHRALRVTFVCIAWVSPGRSTKIR
jgi:hypothetical protein